MKGDVHDIGKNIVGVVLGCNNYEVVDLGVMVSADRILDTAAEEGAQIVGLSGLITPSLDEMVAVASEMERRGLDLPLLIGGATTSKQHTAVRIAPAYSRETVHVLDASRVVGVMSELLDPGRRAALGERTRADQERLRTQHAERGRKPLVSLEEARANRDQVMFDALPEPPFEGRRLVEPTVAELRARTSTGSSSSTRGTSRAGSPRSSSSPPRASSTTTPRRCSTGSRPRTPSAPSASTGSGPPTRTATTSSSTAARLPMLRQQAERGDSRPNLSLADYVAPEGDHLGAFAVAIHGADEAAARFEAEHDDYQAIMTKALADRLAEAFAEWLHERARREWYAPDERLANEDLVAERFRGIRPAFGYPACPDHSREGDALRPARRR